MKRVFVIIISICLFMGVFCGCQKNESPSKKTGEITVKLCTTPSDMTALEYIKEVDISEKEYVDKRAQRKNSIEVAGQTLFVQYQKSKKSVLSPDTVHEYITTTGERLSITDEGKIRMWHRGECRDTTIYSRVLSEEECTKIAIDFLNTQTDASQYTITVREDAQKACYYISFIKIINGFHCSDGAEFCIEKTGHIQYFSSYDLGRMGADTESGFDLAEVEQKVMERLQAEHAPLRDLYHEIRYDKITYVLGVDETNTYVITCAVEVTFIRINENGVQQGFNSGIGLLIQ